MKSFLSVIWFLFGLIMLICGIVSIFTPIETFFTLMLIIPIVLIIGGIVGILHYLNIKNIINAQWLLADSLLSLLFGILFIWGGIGFASIIMIYFVAFLAIFKGILGMISSFDLRKSGFGQWLWLFIISIINIIIGIIFSIHPNVASATIGVLAGIYFVFFGIISLFAWWGTKKFFFN
ncbi:DUF308 domain-containing protein [Helicobacter sp. 11S03491-1]|uniref:HdeD family acid-resistance protein n=1 Tax=Helicobacter sp. 11S03491-1 TaxID=1476196 RepID=UPI000BA4E6AB|nr:DUF308 domain-containing protein [Helicobacter sp. 11S03491-1]PAF42228.1 hypothetical protein BKH45_04600 [Helicobacter sp. 11S03491-1]